MRWALKLFLGTCDPLIFVGRISLGYVRLKLSGAAIGRIPVISGKIRLYIRGEAFIGDRFMVLADSSKVTIQVARGATLTIGNGVFINGGVSIEVWHDVRIGNDVLMAPYASIIDDDRHELEPGSPLYKGQTVIGDDVWLGRNVVVLPGVTVGKGSVIGANSVVTCDILPNSFAVGSPARVIRTLEVPDGWSRRYGYRRDEGTGGVRSILHRIRTMNVGHAVAGTDPPVNAR